MVPVRLFREGKCPGRGGGTEGEKLLHMEEWELYENEEEKDEEEEMVVMEKKNDSL